VIIFAAENSIHFLGLKKLHTEAFRLLAELVGEISPRNSIRESGHIIKPLRGGGLSTQGGTLDDQSVDTFASRIQGGREPCRSTTDDDQLVMASFCLYL
jgi:hypothetical protein